jgi:hypothetical protein
LLFFSRILAAASKCLLNDSPAENSFFNQDVAGWTQDKFCDFVNRGHQPGQETELRLYH